MNHRKIRVLEMIDDASIGGGQTHVFLLAKYLDKNHFDVTIATEPNGFLVDQAKIIRIPTVSIEISNKIRLRTLLEMKRLLSQSQFDILHTHGGTAGFWGRISSVLNGSPRVRIHTYHGFHYLNRGTQASQTFRLIDRFALPFTTRVVCVCKSDLEKDWRQTL